MALNIKYFSILHLVLDYFDPFGVSLKVLRKSLEVVRFLQAQILFLLWYIVLGDGWLIFRDCVLGEYAEKRLLPTHRGEQTEIHADRR
jgi:hypothetical protein